MKKISLLTIPLLALSLGLAARSSDQAKDQASSNTSTAKVAATAKSSKTSQESTAQTSEDTQSTSSQASSSQTSTSQAGSSEESSTSSSQASSSQASGIMQYAPQAIKKAAADSGVDSQYLYVTADGDILSVHENHAKMKADGQNVDDSVDPVIAGYTVNNGQLVSAY